MRRNIKKKKTHRTQTTAILSFGPVFVNTAFSLDISYIRPKMTLVSNKKKDKQKKASTYGPNDSYRHLGPFLAIAVHPNPSHAFKVV